MRALECRNFGMGRIRYRARESGMEHDDGGAIDLIDYGVLTDEYTGP